MTPRSASSGTRWTRLTSASRAKVAPWISWRSASRQTSTPLSPTARMVKAASRAVQRAGGDQVEEQAADQRPADARGGAPSQSPTGDDQQDQVREGAGQVEPGRQRRLQDRRRQQDQRRGQIPHGADGRKSVRTMTME